MKYLLLAILFFTTSLSAVTLDQLSQFGSPEELEHRLSAMKKDKKVEEVKEIEVKNTIVKETSENKETLEIEKKIVSEDQEKAKTKNSQAMKNFVFKYKSDDVVVKERNKLQVKQKNEKLERFGDSFFTNRNIKNISSMSIPNWYQINEGDVIYIWTYGGRNKETKVEVDRNGNINLDGIGPEYVANLQFGELKKRLKDKFKKIYKNSTTTVDIVRTTPIQITVAGEVKNTGLFNVPSFSTVKDALITAGGISKNGSYRNVKIIRDTHVHKTFDLYSLIRNGDSKYLNYSLKRGDVVLVTKNSKSVSIAGEVLRSGVYQLKEGEKLQDLLDFAGGLSPNAEKSSAKLSRLHKNRKRIVKNISLNSDIALQNGDLITVFPININNSESIHIYGNINRVGERGFSDNLTLYKVLQSEKRNFLKNTSTSFSILKRHNRKTYSDEMIPFSISEVLSNKKDYKIEKGDEIYIFNKAELKETPYIYVGGTVVKESGKYQFFENIRLKDLNNIIKFKSEVFDETGKRRVVSLSNEIKIIRNIRDDIEILFLNISEDSDFLLQPFDEVIFFDKTERENPKFITIRGQVNETGKFRIDDNTDINKVIKLAKGLQKNAYLDKFEVVRYWVENGERKYKVIEKSLSEAINENFKVEDFDEISIFRIPKWFERNSVTITGEVKFPGTYIIHKGDTLQSLISRAGGLLDTAFLRGAFFQRESIKKLQKTQLENSVKKLKNDSLYLLSLPKSFGESESEKMGLVKVIDSLVAELRDFEPNGRISIDIQKDRDFILENGDNLFIPTINETVTVIGEVLNPHSSFFKEGKGIEYYLDKSGGTNHKADLDNIYIVHPNGEAEKYQSGFLFGFGGGVETGDTIIVPLEIKTASFTNIAKDVTQIMYQLAITAVSLKTVGVF
jgi:polysaccharide export outer membrane protein